MEAWQIGSLVAGVIVVIVLGLFVTGVIAKGVEQDKRPGYLDPRRGR